VNLRKPLADLPANARYSVLLEPLWAVLGTAAIYYAALYMKTVGLSTLGIGLIMSVSLYTGVFWQLAAGTLTDRMGRHRATFVFDVLSWVVPMFLWAVADSFWLFLVAYLFNATSRVVNVSFGLLLTEDVGEDQRPRVFGAIKLIIMVAGLLTPVIGVFMQRYGTLRTLRMVYLLGGVCMLVHVLVRNHLTTETTEGLRARGLHRSIGLARQVGSGVRLFARAVTDRRLAVLVAVYALTYLGWQVNIFQVVYLVDVLGFGPEQVSYLPALAAAAALVCYLLVMPRLRRRPVESNTRAALVVCTAGWVLFLVVPRHGLVLLVISTVLSAAGQFLVESYRDALVVSRLPAAQRAGLFSAIQTVTAVTAVPSGYVGALLYDRAPIWLFATIAGLYGLAGAVAFALTPVPVRLREEPLEPACSEV
jgi:MFS family permease